MRNINLLLGAFSLAAASAGVTVACEDAGTPPTDYAPMLRSVTEASIVPSHDAFATQADALAAAAATLQTTTDADSLGKLQTAWRSSRRAWRALDVFHFGPVADLAIGERIDVSPANGEDIERIVAGTDPIDVGKASGGSKGFLGLQYLIFSKGGDEGDPLGKLQGSERRRALVKAIADEIASSAHQLVDAWKNGYANELEKAGAGSARYPTQRAAVDDLVAGGGYALEVIVGVRLAEPLGRTSGGTPDASKDPTAASDSAIDDMTSTLSGVRTIYQNDGFSSRVRTRAQALDDRVNAELADCNAKLASIPKPFAESVTKSTATVTAAYDACKSLKATWNTDLTSAIGATLKPADNDGD